MNEQQVKELIIDRFGSINAFSEKIQIANSTVVSILERGFLNAKLKNVFAICKGLNISPEDLESGFDFVRTLNYVNGDNNGVNGLNAGSGNNNTYNFNSRDEECQKGYNNEILDAVAVDQQTQLQIIELFEKQLKIQQDMNAKLDVIIELLRK